MFVDLIRVEYRFCDEDLEAFRGLVRPTCTHSELVLSQWE
jgi:hypothetical protein